MDPLLRYALYQVTWAAVYFEIALMVFFTILIIVIKSYARWKERWKKNFDHKLSELIEGALFNPHLLKSLQVPENLRDFKCSVEVLEKYEHRIKDPSWTEIKDKILKTSLLPQ